MCMKGLTHLCRDIPGRGSKGQVIYSLVHFFAAGLDRLQELGAEEAVCKVSIVSYNQSSGCNMNLEPRNGSFVIISRYSKFLAKILSCPDLQKANTSHIEVLEGMLSILLQRTGELLSEVVFSNVVSSSTRPGRIASSTPETPSSLKELAAEITGRRLASILQYALEGRSEKEKVSVAAMLSGTKLSGKHAKETTLLTRARHRLQETLLKGIFGQDGEEFMNALRTPDTVENCATGTPHAFGVRNEGFVESVWSAVGWDLILSC
jgi:hypothetical protein